MKNLSIETIEKTLQENFANDFATMVELANEANNSVYGNSEALETLIEMKHFVANDIATLLDVEEEDYEAIDFIDLTIGNLVDDLVVID